MDYIGPLFTLGSLLMVHKDNAGRFKSLADFNDPGVTFSVVSGGSEEPRIPVLFPKAKLITTTGQAELGAEPVRAKKSDVWMSSQVTVLADGQAQQLGASLRSREADRSAAEQLGGALRRS